MTAVAVLKVQLADARPPIWRRLVVPTSLTLFELHAVIQGAMGWTDSHLHMFVKGEARYMLPEEDEPDDEYLDERRYTLADLTDRKGARFTYEYDFGDGWEHRITVEDLSEVPGQVEPHCTAGKRARPPEDCGGPFGYAELLETLADPKHPEHREMKEWAGEIDAEAFDLAEANAGIAAAYRHRRKPRGSGG
jgi:hypothetical protein